MSDKTLMLIVALVSILCAFWALFVPSMAMAMALIMNAVLCVYLAFKLDKKKN